METPTGLSPKLTAALKSLQGKEDDLSGEPCDNCEDHPGDETDWRKHNTLREECGTCHGVGY